jgi:hypothetical protein
VDEPGGEDAIRAYLAEQNDATGGRSATIDGRAVEDLDRYRVTSPQFEAFVPEDNLFRDYGFPEMVTGPDFDDGWYLMLAPLSVGEHTVSFTGSDGYVNVTYHLSVVGE